MTALTRAELVAIFRRIADAVEGDIHPKPIMSVLGFQQAFNSLRATGYPRLVEDGAHGPVTTFALKQLQATAGIPVTGEIDEATVDILCKNIPSL